MDYEDIITIWPLELKKKNKRIYLLTHLKKTGGLGFYKIINCSKINCFKGKLYLLLIVSDANDLKDNKISSSLKTVELLWVGQWCLFKYNYF